MDHDGFSVIECLSECVEFYEGAFDASNPRKGGKFELVPAGHDVTDEVAAYKLADAPFPGLLRHFLQIRPADQEQARGRHQRRKRGKKWPARRIGKSSRPLSTG